MLKSIVCRLVLSGIIVLSGGCGLGRKGQPTGTIQYTVPIDFSSHLVQVPIDLNGAGPEPFIVDTGLVGMIISEEYAAATNARMTGKTAEVSGTGGTAVRNMKVIQNLRMDLEGLQWPIKTAKVAPQDVTTPISEAIGFPFNGMIGAFLFETYVVEIDFQRELMTLYPPKNFDYAGNGIVLPLQLRRRKPYIKATVQQTPQSEPQQGTFLLDLGSSRSLDIRGDITPPPGLPKRHLLGFGGERLAPMGRVHTLTLGAHVIERPVTTYEPSQGESTRTISGRIGNQILSRYKVIFNYALKQVILEPIESPSPTQADMSGLRLKLRAGAQGDVFVSHVYPNTPAQDAGVQTGDRILEIDGKSVRQLPLPVIRAQFIDRDQPTRQLLIQRDQNKLSVEIRLRPLI